MKIGIASPAEVHSFKPFLPKDLHTDLPRGTGGTNIPTYLAQGLIARGHHVSIYTLDSSIKEPQVFSGAHITVYVGRYREPARCRMIDLFKEESATIRWFIEQDQPDVVNAHWIYEYALGALATTTPTLVIARDAPFQILRYQTNLYRFVRLLIAYRALRKTKHLAAVSPYVAKHIEHWFFYRKPIDIISNGVDITRYESYGHNEKIERDRTVFFSIANGWGRRKNEKRLLYAFSRVHRRYPKTELWMFGADHSDGELAFRWAEKRKLTDGVKFLGKRSHSELMRLIASEADVLVHPSLEESFGNIYLEAGLLGKAIIAGKNSGASPNTLGNGKAGMLVDIRSVNEIANGMLVLAGDKNLRITMGEKARQYVIYKFPLEKMVDTYEEALIKLII